MIIDYVIANFEIIVFIFSIFLFVGCEANNTENNKVVLKAIILTFGFSLKPPRKFNVIKMYTKQNSTYLLAIIESMKTKYN